MPEPVQPDPDEAERLLKALQVQILGQRAKNVELERRRNAFRALGIVVVILGLLALFAMMQAAPLLLKKATPEGSTP